MVSGTPPRKYPWAMSFWLAWFQVQARELNGDLLTAILSLTVENDVLFSTSMKQPGTLASFMSDYRAEFTSLGRSLCKRGILDLERKTQVGN